MATAELDCAATNDDGTCRDSKPPNPASAMLDEVTDSNWQTAVTRTAFLDDPYGYSGNPASVTATTDVVPLTDPYDYSGSPSNKDSAVDDASSAKNEALQKLGLLDQSDTLERGMVLYDIARESLVARSSVTGEQTDHDSIVRECNRIMVLNGYPDAKLEGKTHITMADLPRAWNGVRWDQEFKLYDETALNAFGDLAVKSAAREGDPPPPQGDPPPPQGDPPPPQGDPPPPQGDPPPLQGDPPPPQGDPPPPQGDPPPPQGDSRVKASLDDANSFFICQFTDKRFNPNGPPSSNDCGPASLAMIARYYGAQFDDPEKGAIDSGTVDPAQLVSSVRFLMTGSRNENDLTGLGQIEQAAKQMGLETGSVKSLADLDKALDSGVMVVLAGNPKDYQKDLGLHYGKGGTIYDGGHFVTIVGRQGDSYIVNDPANHGGALTLTREQIEKYVSYVRAENMGLAMHKQRGTDNDERSEPPAPPAAQTESDVVHMHTVDGFQSDKHPDLNLDLRGFSPISGMPHYSSDTGRSDSRAPQLASLFGQQHPVNEEELPAVRQLYRVNDWNWDDSIPKSESKGTRGAPITSTEVTMLGFESIPGEPIYLPDSGYRVDREGHQGQVLYLDRAKGEVTIAYNLSGTVAGGYTLHLRGADFDPSLAEGGLVSADAPLGTARNDEVQVAMTDRGTFMDIRFTNHWWKRRTRR